jgi:hypothetical protein
MADLGCAQDADGNLLSPSKIRWYNDVDDVDPISGGSSAASHPTPSSLAKPTTLDRFFTTSSNLTVASADKVAGSRRSNRATRPSTRVVDPNNAEAPTFSVSSSLKRKASTSTFASKLSRARKVIEDSDDGGTATETEGGDGDDDAGEPAGEADSGGEDVDTKYMSTKALGDADREASYDFYYC